MKDTIKLFNIIILIVLFACNENKIKVSEGKFEIPEPDKPIRIEVEVKKSLLMVAKEITISDNIESCMNGKKLVNSGVEILPYLRVSFTDSTETKVFSKINKRILSIGEIAIVIASAIKPIPIARVVGIQQCTPPFNMNIESYLWKIKKNPSDFILKYDQWIKEVL
jgi:hypothetical protein